MLGPQHLVRVPGLLMVGMAVIGSMLVGSDLSEGPVADEDKVFLVSWITGAVSIPSGNGRTNDGGTSTTMVDLDLWNLTSVSFRVTWQDNARLSALFPATVTMTVRDPNGTVAGEGSGTSGATGVTVRMDDLNTPYDLQRIEAGSEEEALKVLSRECPPLSSGMGEWELTLSVQRDFPLPIGQRSVDWSIGSDAVFFSAELEAEGTGNG